jgi:hypothetical protein
VQNEREMVGTCFYYDTFPKGQHLWVVLAPSVDEPNSFICVNLETKRDNSDPTCIVRQGEHPNLPKPESAVLYVFARDLPLRLISRLQTEQRIPKMSDALLLKIQTAALTDDSKLKIKFKKAIQKYLGISS